MSGLPPMRRLRRLLAGACVALAMAAGAGALDAQQPTDREIADSQRRLEQIRRERTQLREEMERIRSRVSDISGELRNLERQANMSASALTELEFQLDQRQRQIEENAQDLSIAQGQLVRRRQILNRRLRDIYKRGPLHAHQVLLTADSFADLLNRYRYLHMIARHDHGLVRDIARMEVQLRARERTLQRSLGQLQGLQEEKAVEHAELAHLQQQQRQALSTVRTRERTTAQRIEQLAADERRITSLIATLERKRREAEEEARRRAVASNTPVAAPAAGTITARSLGTLAWPVEGRLLYRFGRAPQANGTVLRWNGIGIGAAAGTGVAAVEGGTVVMAGPFEGYGPTVVLSHGGGYYSLYLYLREVRVREGAEVTRGQVIGTVAGDGTAEGPHIEFQIRAPGGEAVDPLAWLQRRPS